MTCIVTDIEGTTSSISFVKDVLFPYAATSLPAFVQAHAQDQKIAEIITAIKQQCHLKSNDAVVQQCLDWIAADEKQTALKALQGHIWKLGYERGDYQAHVYPDAFEKLTDWHQAGIPLYVYSSGSIYAQELFFHYSCFGDMRGLFLGNFDTTTGPKQDVASYRAIAQAISDDASDKAQDIIFLSDIIAELDAAQDAGMQTWHVQREENMCSSERHRVVATFNDIVLP